MKGIKLHYPIKLYLKKSILLWGLIALLGLSLLGGWGVGRPNQDWLNFTIFLIWLIIGVGGFITTLFVFIKNEPIITLYPSKIEIFRLHRKNQQLFWSQIENIELIEISTVQGAKNWGLTITPKNDKKITRGLQAMTCNNLILNQKEVFAIIEQSFQGKEPIYQQIDFPLKEQFGIKIDFWLWVFIIGALIIALFCGFILPIL